MSDLRVLLVEDQTQMRAYVSELLRSHCIVVGTADRGDVVVSLTAELRPDVVVLDISLPGQNGLEVLLDLRRLYPSVSIVMLTNQNDPIVREEATRRGADGYVMKFRASRELWTTIQKAVSIHNRKPKQLGTVYS
jgi:DNA-binding NarL/FixJ family response regulator